MAVKRRMIECECGQVFTDGKPHLEGPTKYGPWKYKTNRLRETKTKNGGDIVVVCWERSVECGRCGSELLREKRQYELTPPLNAQKPEPVPSYGTRELVVMREEEEGIIRVNA